MNTIVPRWEWRTFGDSFGSADDRFAALEPERVHESDEIYLLSAADDADTVKVRDGLMDVKHLEHVDGDGLEQWLPVTKAGFPLPAADVESVFAALRLPAPALERAEYTLDQLLDEVVRPSSRAARRGRAQAPAPLHDRRLHDRMDGRARRRRRRRGRSRSRPRTPPA